jgi:hypothetical protein
MGNAAWLKARKEFSWEKSRRALLEILGLS